MGPDKIWMPWLKRELESRGYFVAALSMPEPNTPKIENWVPALAAAVGSPEADDIFVGHSMGVQAIVRYLETLPQNAKVAGAVFVGGFFSRLTHCDETPEDSAVRKHWMEKKPDLKAAAAKMRRSTAIFSDNDPYVPVDNIPDFRNLLGSEIVLIPGAGHFASAENCLELPIVLEAIEIIEAAQ